MNCEWCAHGKEATWWIRSKIGMMSWACDACRDRICDRDEKGGFIAIPATERLAQIHSGAPGAGEGGQK